MPPATQSPVTVHTASLRGVTVTGVDVSFTASPGAPALRLSGVSSVTSHFLEPLVLRTVRATHDPLPAFEVRAHVPTGPEPLGHSALDLPLALGWLAAAGVLPPETLDRRLVVGGLNADGDVLSPHGSAALASFAQPLAFDEVLVPFSVAEQAALLTPVDVIGVRSLAHAVEHLLGTTPCPRTPRPVPHRHRPLYSPAGLDVALRVLAIAAAGSHRALLFAPSDIPPFHLARLLSSYLPHLTFGEINELTHISSIAGVDLHLPEVARPIRSPHPPASPTSFLGTLRGTRLGECTLAHHGVLFLHEAEAFSHPTLAALREPLEHGTVTLPSLRPDGPPSVLPARFDLLAVAATCPCGRYNSRLDPPCSCSQTEIEAYQAHVLAPLDDLLDLRVDLMQLGRRCESLPTFEEPRAGARRIDRARNRQSRRSSLNGHQPSVDALLQPAVHSDAFALYVETVDRLALSETTARSILRVARTIADLEPSHVLTVPHLREALCYCVPKLLSEAL